MGYSDFFGDGTGQDNLPTGPSGQPRGYRGYGGNRGGFDRGGGGGGWRNNDRGGDDRDRGGNMRDRDDPNAGRSDAARDWRGGNRDRSSRIGGSSFGGSNYGNRYGGGWGNRDRDRDQPSSMSYAPNRFGASKGGGWRDRLGASRDQHYSRDTNRGYREEQHPPPQQRRDKNTGINVMDADSSSDSDSDSDSSEDTRSKRQRKQKKKKGKKNKKDEDKPFVPKIRKFQETKTLISKESLESRLVKALENKNPVTIADLADGLADLDFNDADTKTDFVRLVHLSGLCNPKITAFNWKTLIGTLKDKYTGQVLDLVLDILLFVKEKMGIQDFKNNLTKEDKSEINTFFTNELADEKKIEALLLDNELMFLLPTPDLSEYVQKSLADGNSLKDLLDYINKEVSLKISVSELTIPIAKDAFSKVFLKDKINLDALADYTDLLKRTCSTPISDLPAQAMIIYEAQSAWRTSKSKKGVIQDLFKKLHELSIVSPEGLVYWRDDRKVKSKGKPKVLLYVNSWIAQIEEEFIKPHLVHSDDEGDEGDDDEIDQYLQNPNLAFFQ